MTDEDYMYRKIGRKFAEHSAVKHYEKDYVRGDVTTSTVEGAFSIFKRGMRGVYQHCARSTCRTAPRSTCTGIWPSLSFATATAKRSALMIASVRSKRSRASPARPREHSCCVGGR